jgi:hypothetical protein
MRDQSCQPLTETAQKARFNLNLRGEARNLANGDATCKPDGRRDGIPSAAPPLVSCRRQTSSAPYQCRTGAVIDARVRIDPDLDIEIALERGGFFRRKRFHLWRLRG